MGTIFTAEERPLYLPLSLTLTNLPERLACVMSFSLLTDDALCEVARRDMPLLLALQATCKDARRVLSR